MTLLVTLLAGRSLLVDLLRPVDIAARLGESVVRQVLIARDVLARSQRRSTLSAPAALAPPMLFDRL